MNRTAITFLISLFLTVSGFIFSAALTEKEIKEMENSLSFGVPDERKQVLQKISELKDTKLNFLIKKTIEEDKDTDILEMAIRLAGEMKIPGIEEAIFAAMEAKEEPKIKAAAIRTLGKLKYKKIAAKAIEELANENKIILTAAVTALGDLEEKAALEKLYAILDKVDEKEEILQEVIGSIGKIKDKKSIEKLKEVLENPGFSRFVRMYVPIALAQIGGKEVLDILEKATQEKDYFIRIRAIYAISEVHGADLSALKKTITAALKDSDVNIRLTALDVVKNSKDKTYVDFMKYIMEKDPEVKVRKKATEVYSGLDDPAAVVKYFSEKLSKGEFYTKKFVIEAMKDLDITAVLPMLEESFYSQDNFELRKIIITFLTDKIEKDPALTLLKKIALSKDLKGYFDTVNRTRALAIQALNKSGWNKAIDTLQFIAEDDKDPMQINTLQQITFLDQENARIYFLELLAKAKSKPHAVRYQTVKSLFQLHPAGIEENLKTAFFNEEDITIRNYIGRTLKSYGLDNEALEKQYQERKLKTPEDLKKPQQEKSKNPFLKEKKESQAENKADSPKEEPRQK